MPNWDSRNRSAMNSAEIAAAYLDDREDELLDAVGTAPALVGTAESVERCELLDFFDRRERILPFFAVWMLPLGLMLLAEDVPPLRAKRPGRSCGMRKLGYG